MGHVVARQQQPAAMTSLPAALGLAGLATASTAITLAVSNNPRLIGLHGSASYHLALSGVFCAGVAEVGAAVWWTTTYPRGRVAAGATRNRKLILYASLVPLAAAAGLAVATLFWL